MGLHPVSLDQLEAHNAGRAEIRKEAAKVVETDSIADRIAAEVFKFLPLRRRLSEPEQVRFHGFMQHLVSETVADAIAAERERAAKVVESALRADFKAKTGQERGLSEAEMFLATAIRSIT